VKKNKKKEGTLVQIRETSTNHLKANLEKKVGITGKKGGRKRCVDSMQARQGYSKTEVDEGRI